MPKPLGIGLRATERGTLSFSVVHPSRAEDRIYDAVDEAIAAGMTPTQFVATAREAWADRLKEQAKDADSEFQRAVR